MNDASFAKRPRCDTCQPLKNGAGRYGKEEKTSSSLVVKGRRSHTEDDGERQGRRVQNRQGIDGSKTWGVVEYAGISSARQGGAADPETGQGGQQGWSGRPARRRRFKTSPE
jgi:hypothetical protein